MSDRTPRLETFVENLVEGRLADVHTCLPAKVVEFDAGQNKVSVQPLIKVSFIDDDGENQEETLPQISDVPVLYPRAGGGKFAIVFPLEAGDFVTLVFAERSLDRWLSGDGAAVNPGDLRKHQLSDAIAIPGGYPFGSGETVESDRVTIKFGSNSRMEIYEDKILVDFNGTLIAVKDGLIELGEENAGEKVAIESKIQQELNKIATELTKINTALTTNDTHTHLGNTGFPTGPPIPLMAASISYTESPTESSLVTIKE